MSNATRYELLAASSRRELVLITDVIDRTHMVQLPLTGADAHELCPVDCHQVAALVDAGLLQVGDVAVSVAWYGGQTAHGYRLLLTEDGLARMDAELVDHTELTSHMIGGIAA